MRGFPVVKILENRPVDFMIFEDERSADLWCRDKSDWHRTGGAGPQDKPFWAGNVYTYNADTGALEL